MYSPGLTSTINNCRLSETYVDVVGAESENRTPRDYSPYQLLLLTTLQTNTQNNLDFSHALPAAHAVWLNTQNRA